MKTVAIYLLASLLACCSVKRNDKMELGDSTLVNAAPAVSESSADTTNVTSEEDNDCVFNNDYKTLTTDWLHELNKTEFSWRPDLNRALVPAGEDTVFLLMGGCDHFAILVEMKLSNDAHAITDSLFWIQKALQLADEYKMENYSRMIRSGRLRKDQKSSSRIWYDVDDDDEEDNLFYNGIEISEEGDVSKISITQYYN